MGGLILLVGAAAVLTLDARPSGSPPPSLPAALADLERRSIRVGGQGLDVVVAQDHARGLMGVADLGPIDGMLFVFPAEVEPVQHRFWMQGVLIPLDVAFFAGDGTLVSQITMPLCPEPDQATRSCPLHAAEGPFRWALETEAGTFRFPPGSRSELAG